jgi:hypothetical protein
MNSKVLDIINKKEEQAELLGWLQKRARLITFLGGHNIIVNKSERFTCGVIGCADKVIGVRLNGVEHRLDVRMTVPEWFNRFVD